MHAVDQLSKLQRHGSGSALLRGHLDASAHPVHRRLQPLARFAAQAAAGSPPAPGRRGTLPGSHPCPGRCLPRPGAGLSSGRGRHSCRSPPCAPPRAGAAPSVERGGEEVQFGSIQGCKGECRPWRPVSSFSVVLRQRRRFPVPALHFGGVSRWQYACSHCCTRGGRRSVQRQRQRQRKGSAQAVACVCTGLPNSEPS